MSLVAFLITLGCLIGLCLVVRHFVDLPAWVKTIFYVLALVVCILLLLSIAGVNLSGIHVGR